MCHDVQHAVLISKAIKYASISTQRLGPFSSGKKFGRPYVRSNDAGSRCGVSLHRHNAGLKFYPLNVDFVMRNNLMGGKIE